MDRILGLDIGTNSIGWAIIGENDKIEQSGASTFNDYRYEIQEYHPKTRHTFSTRFIVTFILTSIMLVLAVYMSAHWQYWLNMGIGGIYILINTKVFKDRN